jgi:hypothetical protein
MQFGCFSRVRNLNLIEKSLIRSKNNQHPEYKEVHSMPVHIKGIESSVAEPEPRAEETTLNCLPEPEPGPKLRTAAPAPFYLPQKSWLLKNFL